MAAKEKDPVVSLQVISVLLLGAWVTILAGCSRSEQEAQATPPPGRLVSLTGAGATFPSVLYNRWFSVYHDSHPNTLIKYAAVGSGEGVRRFIGKNIPEEERVDFGASDAAMSDAEIETCQQQCSDGPGYCRLCCAGL